MRRTRWRNMISLMSRSEYHILSRLFCFFGALADHQTRRDQWMHTFNTNIHAYFFMAKYALPHMKEGDAIINTSSVTAYVGTGPGVDYISTKGAINAFTRALSNEQVRKGIRVNAVAAGPVWTPLITSTMDKESIEHFGQSTPMGRPGQP